MTASMERIIQRIEALPDREQERYARALKTLLDRDRDTDAALQIGLDELSKGQFTVHEPGMIAADFRTRHGVG